MAKGLRSGSLALRKLGEKDEDADHVARYSVWAGLAWPQKGATPGVATAANTLMQMMAALGTLQQRFDQLYASFQEMETGGIMASAFNGEQPEAAEAAASASTDIAKAAECCEAALRRLPSSTVWVELPDPVATAGALEESAKALEKGQAQLAELEALEVVALNRINALASTKQSTPNAVLLGRLALTQGTCSTEPCCKLLGDTRIWSEVRSLFKGLRGTRQMGAEAASVLSEVFHIFDDLIDGLARILEELICLESETDSMCPALLGAAQVQQELLEWKLTLLDNAELDPEQHCRFMDFIEVVLAVGDTVQAATAQLRRRRQKVVEGLKTSIELKAAMMPSPEEQPREPQLLAEDFQEAISVD
ncbi:rpa1, partial [Symbiodinium pilosum]